MNALMDKKKQILIQFLIFVSIWLFAFWGALSSAVDVWLSSETYKHCFFILPLSLYLVYERREELRLVSFAPNYRMAMPLLFAFCLNLVGELLGLNLVTHGAAFIGLVSIIWLCFGNDFVGRFWFPVLFLGFAVPFGEELVPALQDITAYMTVELVRLFGIPIYRDGLYLYVPNGTFLVAEACAGIRFLIAAFALGTLFSYLNYKTKWKFYGFIAVSIIVPIIANGIRAFGIVAIGYSTNMEHAVGADHLVYGWFFFAFVLLLLFGLGQLGREKTLISVHPDEKDGELSTMSLKPIFMLVIISLCFPIYTHMINSYERTDATDVLSNAISKYPDAKPELMTWAPMMASPHETWSGKLNGHDIYVAYYHADNNEHELVSGLNRYFNIDIYTRKNASVEQTPFGKVNRVSIVDVSGKQVELFYWFSVDEKRFSGSLSTKIAQAKSKLAGHRGSGHLIAIASEDLDDISSLFEFEKRGGLADVK
ncbi:exosortase A [Glaciecola sp. KUL10]|uniref:exosortase A n=1 Tax=Glaciecola sp. (strain KUL10) TaxID=2161813 RepID=UPI000D782739|nr:exosortase A [Glaciecola sp. KUL10]GBL04252.1 eight transmembrane protein EpsH [Glaciecola sp. KUL10]